MAAPVLEPRVFGEPIYDDVLWELGVYGEWTAEEEAAGPGRTASDSITTTESVARAPITFTRSATDTTSITESVVAGRLYGRTVSDTTSLTDVVDRVVSKPRTASDTTTISESVARTAIERTVSDSLTTTESIAQILRRVRTASDTTSLSESVSRGAILHTRYLSEVLTTVDFIDYIGPVPEASGTASATTSIEPFRVEFTDTSTNNPTEWLWDFGDGTTSTEQNPIHIYAAGTYTVTLIATNAGGDSTMYTFPVEIEATARAVPQHGVTPQLEFEIEVNGVDVTDDVRIVDAMFTAQLNGNWGDCQFAVRDLEHTRAFTNGHVINLYIEGRLYWHGFITEVEDQYTFAVDDTTDPTQTERWFLIKGQDVNVLLSKRIVWNIPEPEKGEIPPPQGYAPPDNPLQWKEGTPVSVVLKHILANYTILPSDGVQLLGIQNIGTPNPDGDASYTGAQTVAQFVRNANTLLGGLFYLTPTRRFIYRDVEVATNPYYLSDEPLNLAETFDQYAIGPREYRAVRDAAELVNDALLWTTAPGFDGRVFSRTQDPESQGDHGVWQRGEFNTGIYRQASADARSQAMVFGNTQSQKGARWDRLVVNATVFRPLFMVGDVVECRFESHAGPYHEPFDTPSGNGVGSGPKVATLPLRKMTITFPTKTNVRFDLILTRELDEPWNPYEFIFPAIPGYPGYDFPPFTLPVIPEIILPPSPGVDCEGLFGHEMTIPIEILYRFRINMAGGTNRYHGLGFTIWTGDEELNDFASVYFEVNNAIQGSGTYNNNFWAYLISTDSSEGNSGDYPEGEFPENDTQVANASTLWCRARVRIENDTVKAKVWSEIAGEPLDYAFVHVSDPSFDPPLPYEFFSPSKMKLFSFYFRYATSTGGFPTGVPAGSTTEVDWVEIVEGHPNSPVMLDDWDGPGRDVTGPIPLDGIHRWERSQVAINEGITLANEKVRTTCPSSRTSDGVHLELDLNLHMKFSDFDEAMTGRWGISTLGTAWSNTAPPSGSSVGVVSDQAYAELRPAHGVIMKQLDGGPWQTPTGFTMTTLGDINKVVPSTSGMYFLFDFIFLTGGSQANLSVSVSNQAGIGTLELFDDGGSDSFAFTSFASNGFQVKWERVPGGVSRAKIWDAFTLEPAEWHVESTAATVYDDFHVALDNNASGATYDPTRMLLSWIDFDYSGKPCLPCSTGGSGTMFDNFDRANAASWGTATPGGDTWDHSSSIEAVGVTTTKDIINGAGRLMTPATNVDAVIRPAARVFPDSMALSQSFALRMKLKFVQQDLTSTDTVPFWRGNFSNVTVTIETGTEQGGDAGHAIAFSVGGVSGSSRWLPGFELTTGEWYYLRVEQLWQSYARAKIWLADVDEPNLWLFIVGTAGQASYDGDILFFIEAGAGPSGIGAFEVLHDDIELEVEDVDCGVTSGPPGFGVGPSASLATRIDAYNYAAPGAYYPLSSQVYVDGLYQRRDIEYVEVPDSAKITFTTPLAPERQVYLSVTLVQPPPPENLPALPAGGNFTLVFDDDFEDRTIAEGDFVDGGNPYPSGANFYKTADGLYGVYKDGWQDTSQHGRYDPSIISVHDGYLDLHIQTRDGYPRVAALTVLPTGSTAKGGLLGGRSRIVCRADLMLGYKGVPLWWPDYATTDAHKMLYGELDGPESDFNLVPRAFSHYINASDPGEQAYFDYPPGTSWQDWHEYITEWIPGVYVKFFMDGDLVGETFTRVPTTPMHFVLQFETSLLPAPIPNPAVSGHVQIAEVQMWRYDP